MFGTIFFIFSLFKSHFWRTLSSTLACSTKQTLFEKGFIRNVPLEKQFTMAHVRWSPSCRINYLLSKILRLSDCTKKNQINCLVKRAAADGGIGKLLLFEQLSNHLNFFPLLKSTYQIGSYDRTPIRHLSGRRSLFDQCVSHSPSNASVKIRLHRILCTKTLTFCSDRAAPKRSPPQA